MEKLLQHLARRFGAARPRPPAEAIDDPEIRAMDLRMLADLPFPRPALAPGPAPAGAPAAGD